jgi:hypothetical protein
MNSIFMPDGCAKRICPIVNHQFGIANHQSSINNQQSTIEWG